jgi:hypothetical protein
MKRICLSVSVVVVLAALLAGCGSGGGSSSVDLSTPQKAWSQYVTAMQSAEANAFYDLLSSQYLSTVSGKSKQTVLNKWNSTMAAPNSYMMVQLRSIDTTGDQAIATFSFNGNPGYSGQVVLVKEGKSWKIASGTSTKGAAVPGPASSTPSTTSPIK